MPKKPIDYSKACIYKIVCKNPEIKECYVGSTTDLIKRRNCHKYTCNTESNKDYNIYLYKFIRKNYGFDNWQVIEIEKFKCESKEELHRRERHFIETLNATLNTQKPTRTAKEYTRDTKEKRIKYLNMRI